MITNTHGVGITHHATIRWMLERYPSTYDIGDFLWLMPVVDETYDGALSDINGMPVTEADARAALENLSRGPVSEGNCGGGTGMITYGFKGGTGTSSRVVSYGDRDYTIGTLVQANHGQRDWLTICGVPVGKHLLDNTPQSQLKERGSIIVVIATDLPMMPHQLKRLARRAAIGIGRNGTPGGNNSGDIFLAFSTANPQPMAHRAPPRLAIEMVNDEYLDPVYAAVVDSVEEAVINAMLTAESAGGTPHDRLRVDAIDHEALMAVMRRYGRYLERPPLRFSSLYRPASHAGCRRPCRTAGWDPDPSAPSGRRRVRCCRSCPASAGRWWWRRSASHPQARTDRCVRRRFPPRPTRSALAQD
jgi:L-aminopeptidase/D-esterase-like protein